MNEMDKWLISRFDIIENKIDSLSDKVDKRITPLEMFKYKMIGMVILISFTIPILVNYLS